MNTAPASVAVKKRLPRRRLDFNPAAMIKLEGPAFAWLGNQPDAKEGTLSFPEKRQPDWTLT